MLTLPVETLNLVFLMLVQRDKLECMTVCRLWNDAITQHNILYRVIYVHQAKKLDKLISTIRRDEILGTKVERLILELSPNKDFDGTIFASLFPNLRDFTLSSYIYPNDARTSMQPCQDHPWCKYLEIITENNSHLNTKALLSSGICENLTSISVGSHGEEPVHNLIGTFGNAPALKELRLHYFRVSFRDLEMLHNKVPHLNSLSLYSITLFDIIIPQNIQPATFLKRFECTITAPDSSNYYNTYLSYLVKKYTYLEELKMQPELPNSENTGMDENNTDHARDGGAMELSYMKVLAARLKTLSLYFELAQSHDLSMVFNFNLLDASGCKIERLIVDSTVTIISLDQLARTNQVRNIKSLKIERIHLNDIDPVSFEWLKYFISLKDLTLFVVDNRSKSENTLNLTDMLRNLDEIQLEALRLCLPNMELNYSDTTTVCHSLKELALSCVEFKQNMDIYLSQSFPNLKLLKLDECLLKGESMIFPSLNLSYLEIINRHVEQSFPILLITLRDGQQRVYNSCKTPYYFFQPNQDQPQEDIFTLPSIYSQPLFKSKVTPLARVVCNSVCNFIIINSI